MQKQLLGSQTPLAKSGQSMEQSGETGHPMIQEVGSKAPTKNSPIELQEMNAVKEGTRQTLGSQAPISRTAYHGWQSHDTPMSERAMVQGAGIGTQKGSSK